MRVARGDLKKKLVFPIFLLLISAFIIRFIPPVNIYIILGLILLISLFTGLISKLFTSRKYTIIIFLTVFVTLLLLALDLIDPINITLAISLLIGIFILIK